MMDKKQSEGHQDLVVTGRLCNTRFAAKSSLCLSYSSQCMHACVVKVTNQQTEQTVWLGYLEFKLQCC